MVLFKYGFLQHTLPKSYLKVRYYGWMASNSRMTRDRVKWLAWLFLGWTYWLASGVAPQPASGKGVRPQLPERPGGCCAQLSPDPVSRRCEHCGGMLHLIAITDGNGRILVSRPLPQTSLADHVTNYLDSG